MARERQGHATNFPFANSPFPLPLNACRAGFLMHCELWFQYAIGMKEKKRPEQKPERLNGNRKTHLTGYIPKGWVLKTKQKNLGHLWLLGKKKKLCFIDSCKITAVFWQFRNSRIILYWLSYFHFPGHSNWKNTPFVWPNNIKKPTTTHNSFIRSDEGLTLETSAF